jgi:predicted transposase/invertase (TIGR01784 family)
MKDVQRDEDFLKELDMMSGPLKLRLKNDFVAHYVFLKSPEALKGLICALMKLEPSEVKNVRVMNPINYGECVNKLIILDIKVDLDDREFIDVEIQIYIDHDWEKRSLFYLCRTYADGIGAGEDYEKLKPTTLITITDKDLISAKKKRGDAAAVVAVEDSIVAGDGKLSSEDMIAPYLSQGGRSVSKTSSCQRSLNKEESDTKQEFLSEYRVLNVKTHKEYSELLGIKTLNLHHIKNATADDIRSGLVYWAKLFSATTWKQIKNISKRGGAFMEAVKQIYNVNLISEEKTVMEAHQRYLAVQKGQRKYYETLLKQKDAQLEQSRAEAEQSRAELEKKEKLLAKALEEIERLKEHNDEP